MTALRSKSYAAKLLYFCIYKTVRDGHENSEKHLKKTVTMSMAGDLWPVGWDT